MKILYLHGIGSGADSRTSRRLRELLDVEVIAPEIPINPHEAELFVFKTFLEEKPDIVIGASLGGFYAMRLGGCKKILINPAMFADEDIRDSIGLGTHKFLNKRNDNVEEYIIDEQFIEELRDMRLFFKNYILDSETIKETYALFGTHDELFSHYEDFLRMYKNDNNAKLIDSGHRITDECIVNDLIPLINKLSKGVNNEFKRAICNCK